MADVGDPSLQGWIQTGGVVAFASAVLLWLRDYKREVAPVFAQLVSTMNDVKQMLAALLERERARAERLAAQDARARSRMTPTGIPAAMYEDEDTTPITTIPERPPRARSNPGAGSYAMHRGKDPRGEE